MVPPRVVTGWWPWRNHESTTRAWHSSPGHDEARGTASRPMDMAFPPSTKTLAPWCAGPWTSWSPCNLGIEAARCGPAVGGGREWACRWRHSWYLWVLNHVSMTWQEGQGSAGEEEVECAGSLRLSSLQLARRELLLTLPLARWLREGRGRSTRPPTRLAGVLPCGRCWYRCTRCR